MLVVAAHQLRLGRFLEDPESALVAVFLPAVVRQQLPAEIEILVGRLRGQRVQRLVAGVVVEVRQEIGRLCIGLLFPSQVEVGDNGEQVLELLEVGALGNGGEQVVADLPVDPAALFRRDGGQRRLLDLVVDELELVLVLHQQPLPEGGLQHLEGLQQGHSPDGGQLGGEKVLPMQAQYSSRSIRSGGSF